MDIGQITYALIL